MFPRAESGIPRPSPPFTSAISDHPGNSSRFHNRLRAGAAANRIAPALVFVGRTVAVIAFLQQNRIFQGLDQEIHANHLLLQQRPGTHSDDVRRRLRAGTALHLITSALELINRAILVVSILHQDEAVQRLK